MAEPPGGSLLTGERKHFILSVLSSCVRFVSSVLEEVNSGGGDGGCSGVDLPSAV